MIPDGNRKPFCTACLFGAVHLRFRNNGKGFGEGVEAKKIKKFKIKIDKAIKMLLLKKF